MRLSFLGENSRKVGNLTAGTCGLYVPGHPSRGDRSGVWESGQNNGGGVFLRISAVREDGAGVLSGAGCSRVVVLSVAEAVFELNASTKA